MKTYVAPNRDGWIPRDSFANRLKLCRWEARVSVEHLSALTGISHSTLSSWERGSQPDNVEEVCDRVADALRCDRDWLLYGSASLDRQGVGKVFYSYLADRDTPNRTGPGRSERSYRHPAGGEALPIRMY